MRAPTNATFFALICVFQCSRNAIGEFLCDEYQRKEAADKEAGNFYTIAGYRVPRGRYTRRVRENVTCPCYSSAQLCLRKCCLQDDVFVSPQVKRCRSHGHADEEDADTISGLITTGDYVTVYGSHCPSTVRQLGHFELARNGTMLLPDRSLEPGEYCIEYFEGAGQYMLMHCVRRQRIVKSIHKLYTICLGLSIVCLVVTFGIYFCVDVLRNLPGKILLCYVTSLIITDGTFIVLQVFLITEGTICIAAAFIAQFSFLASFFWLNVMCFDLCLAFRRIRSFNGSSGERELKKFLIYCLYAWGVPLIISFITMLTEFSIIPGNYVKPEFGKDSCWFKSYEAKFWYFYSFISIILLVNLIMFVSTAILIFEEERLWKVCTKNGSKRHNEQVKKRFFLYLKLFLIMGVNWIMEVLSYYIQGGDNFFFITDIANTLIGVFIFAIFVCKRKVFVLLNKRLCPGVMLIRDNRRRRISSRSSTTNMTPSGKENSCVGNRASSSTTETAMSVSNSNNDSDFHSCTSEM